MSILLFWFLHISSLNCHFFGNFRCDFQNVIFSTKKLRFYIKIMFFRKNWVFFTKNLTFSINDWTDSTEIPIIFQEFVVLSNKSFLKLREYCLKKQIYFYTQKHVFISKISCISKISFRIEKSIFFLNQFYFSSKDSFFHEKPTFTLKHLILHKKIDSFIKFQYAHLRRILYFHQKNRYFHSFFNCFSQKTCVNQSHILRMFIVTVYEVSEKKKSHLKYFIWLLGNCSEHYKWARCQLETLFMDACKVFSTYFFFFSCFLSRKHQHSLCTIQLLLNT